MNIYALPNKSLGLVVLFLIIVGSCLFGITLYAGGGEMNSVVAINLNAIKDQADLILIGSLEIVDQPNEVIGEKRFYENGILGNKFYQIKAVEILKGHLPPKCFLIVRTNVSSSEGKSPSVESLQYLLFLQKVELNEDAVLC